MEDDEDEVRNIEDIMEATSRGVVKGSMFFKYFRMGSTVCTTLIMTGLFILTQIFVSLNDLCVPFM